MLPRRATDTTSSGVEPRPERHGLALRCRLALGRWTDRWFDHRHRVDTCGQLAVWQLGIPERARRGAYGFASTPTRTFKAIMRALPIAHRDFVFVDYGSGKGRVLLLASQFPFRRIIGIEHAEELAAISRANLHDFRGRRACASAEVVTGNAVGFIPPADENCLIYLFNPFAESLLTQAIDTIVAAPAKPGRRVLLCFAQQTSPLSRPVDPARLNPRLRRLVLGPLAVDWLAHPRIDVSLFEVGRDV